MIFQFSKNREDDILFSMEYHVYWLVNTIKMENTVFSQVKMLMEI